MARPNNWLNEYAHNVTSQFGEDGVIAKILEVIGQTDRWCVEFGAWDGKTSSNTYNLIVNKGYSAVLIEADAARFEELKKTYDGQGTVIPMCALVGFDTGNNLDVLLEGTGIPLDFDVLSVDVDGNDYHIWDAMKKYNPKVVVIEFNPSIPASIEFVQKRDVKVMHGSSLLSISQLAKSKGYELVAVTKINGVFVASRYFSLFDIADNSVRAMQTDDSWVTYLISGYDGTVFVRGCGVMPWHQVPYREERVQQLPGYFRAFPDNYSRLRQRLFHLYTRYWLKAK